MSFPKSNLIDEDTSAHRALSIQLSPVSSGMPLHIVRELYSTFGNLRKRISDFIRYRRVIVNMNTRFPTATSAELADMDRTCIVCREEMHGAGMNAPTHLVSKKLPCGHIFHFDCLRSNSLLPP